MHIWLRGWAARVFLIVAAVLGFLAGLATVLDFFDAHWPFTVPATLAWAVVLWTFATPKGEPGDRPADILLTKLFVTIILLAITFGAIAAAIWIFALVADNWPYVVIALVIVGVIVLWAVIAGAMDERKARRKAAEE
jgi:hypothetical protein